MLMKVWNRKKREEEKKKEATCLDEKARGLPFRNTSSFYIRNYSYSAALIPASSSS